MPHYISNHKNRFMPRVISKMILCVLFLFIFGIFFITTFSFIKYQTLYALSLLLAGAMLFACLFAKNNDLFSPINWFSASYFGYVLGGVYFSYDNIGNGRFFNLANIAENDAAYYLILAQAWAIVNYFAFVIGYSVGNTGSDYSDSYDFSGKFNLFFEKTIPVVIFVMFLCGFLYWVYLAYMLAGGPVAFLVNFAAFNHVIKESGLTTLPYHFVYAAIYLSAILSVVRKKSFSIFFYIASICAFMMIISQGRISNAITFLLSLILIYFFSNRSRLKTSKIVAGVIALITLAFLILFLRVASSYHYIGSSPVFFSLSNYFETCLLFIEMIVGWGNVADLQQLVLAFKTWDISSSLMGVTYFDWFRNMFSSFGFEPTSVGIRILKIYFPDKIGGPTPGAIGELYVNFNIMGFMGMFFIGLVFARIYNLVKRSGSIFLLFLYSAFLLKFVFLFAKVDSTVIVSFLWAVMPVTILLCLLYFLYFCIYKNGKKALIVNKYKEI